MDLSTSVERLAERAALPEDAAVRVEVWQLAEAEKAPFASRLLVRRPIDAGDFNGTVVIEWLNVSGGADGDPGFMYNWEEISREGYAWVGVSAHAAGVVGEGFALGQAMPLVQADPERYGALAHPGDAYSFDSIRVLRRSSAVRAAWTCSTASCPSD